MLNKGSKPRFPGVILIASILVLTTVDADAYIDPGSSSYFFQLLIAGLTAFLYFFSSIKRKVLGLFRKDAPQPEKTDGATEKQQALERDDSHSTK